MVKKDAHGLAQLFQVFTDTCITKKIIMISDP